MGTAERGNGGAALVGLLAGLLAGLAMPLAGQDANVLEQARAEMGRITATPLTDPVNLPRIALRAPLLADPGVPLAELQAAQNRLLRLSRMAAPVLAEPGADGGGAAMPVVYRVPRLGAHKAMGKQSRQSSEGPLNTPGGGVDGRVTGAYGVCTQFEENPWWQVDLGAVEEISAIRIHANLVYPERARDARILLSEDGERWSEARAGARARFVRVERHGRGVLQFDEVEVR